MLALFLMELRRLAYLVAVVKEGSFTKAAATAHVAQSGVSAQIRLLERELGETLLDRTGSVVQPTAAGAAVLPYAQAALDAVDGARLAIAEMKGLVRGQVVVGSIGSSRIDVPTLLAEFHTAHPTIDIRLAESDSQTLEHRLLSGNMDVAIVSPGYERLPGLRYRTLVDDIVAAAVSTDDPLMGQSNVRIDALRARTIVTLPRGTGTRSRFDAACAKAAFTPKVRFEASDPAAVAKLALLGLGVAVVPISFARRVNGLHPMTIGEPPLRAQLALAWHETAPKSPAARALIAYVLDAHAKTQIFGVDD